MSFRVRGRRGGQRIVEHMCRQAEAQIVRAEIVQAESSAEDNGGDGLRKVHVDHAEGCARQKGRPKGAHTEAAQLAGNALAEDEFFDQRADQAERQPSEGRILHSHEYLRNTIIGEFEHYGQGAVAKDQQEKGGQHTGYIRGREALRGMATRCEAVAAHHLRHPQ